MHNKPLITALAACVVLVAGCAKPDAISAGQPLCTSSWYSLVEKQVPTGDGKGHGPDPGSTEWRSVVEFKLGIRGDPGVPPLDTDQWCAYIDKHYV